MADWKKLLGVERRPSAASLPPANWYPDPYDATILRFWDGCQWTAHTAPSHQPRIDHISAASNLPAVVRQGPVDVQLAADGSVAHDSARAETVEMAPPSNSMGLAAGEPPSLREVVEGLQHEAPRHPLDEQVEVAGETHHIKGIKKVFRECGMPITARGNTIEAIECILVPEPWNAYDQNAVAVMIGMSQVGYLPAHLAVDYSGGLGRLAKAGLLATGQARIWAKLESSVVWARVTILIPEADQFA